MGSVSEIIERTVSTKRGTGQNGRMVMATVLFFAAAPTKVRGTELIRDGCKLHGSTR